MGRFAKMMPELVDVFRRFPVAVLCCVLAFVININARMDSSWGLEQSETLGLIAAFLGAGVAHLFAEARKWTALPGLVLAAGVAAIFGILAYDPVLFESHRLFLFLGLVLMLFVAPYMRRDAKQGAVWLFGMRLGLAALLALVVGLTLMLGLFAIVNGLKFLLGIDLGRDASEQINMFSVYLVGPLFGLAMVPRDLEEAINLADHEGGLLERGVSILVNYISVPLALIYAVLLHVYGAKIIGLQSMPKGEVGLVVTLFAIAGTFAWLVAWPFRDTGTRLLKLYSRYWFWFLPVPVGLLALAVWQRVADHGMTPDRYGLILVAAWAGLVCVYLMLRRSFADMRVIIGGAAALLVLGSFGPFGALGLTVSSQMARFDKFLTENAMLENGKLKTALPALNQDKKRQGYAFLEVLAQANAFQKVQAYLPAGEKLETPDRYVSEAMRRRFGVDAYWEDNTQINFYVSVQPISFPFAGKGHVLGQFQFANWNLTTPPAEGQAKFSKLNDIVSMTWPGSPDGVPVTVAFDQRAILKQMNEVKVASSPNAQLPLMHAVDDKTSLIITSGTGTYSDAKVELTSLSFWVVMRE
jgi:hypothetical protein